MKITLSFMLSLFLFGQIFSQNTSLWHTNQSDLSLMESTPESTVFPEHKLAFDIQYNAFEEWLRLEAPKEFSGKEGLKVQLPMPNGETETFEVFYSPVVEQGLQEKYPQIRSYKGYNIRNSREVIRMTLSQLGLKASILTTNGEVYIDPFIEGETTTHASYYVKDFEQSIFDEAMPACGTSDIFDNSALQGLDMSQLKESDLSLRSGGEPESMRTFRAAIATTGEWTLSEGGKDNAIAKVIACIDRGNQIFENEIGFRLILVANNDLIVFSDPNADPYPGSEPKAGRELIGMNTGVLNLRVGVGAYDIGHVFTNRCSDVGGVASLASVCGNNKGSATTCWYNRNLDYTVVRIMCHEMGHQFSAPHTFNNCGGNESFATGFEPGSGSTIMSYGGLCGSNNVVSGTAASRDITYYHANSVMRMYTFTRFLNCGGNINTNNTRPVSSMDYEDNFTIPASTPFYLEGEGIDMEGDNLTYCFEQHDFGSGSCPLGMPSKQCPTYRSFPPNGDNYRVFPSFTTIWNNQIANSQNEVLVDYSREYNFILTVRDNNPEVGAWGMDTVTFFTEDTGEPFSVTYPNNGEDQIAGAYSEITWNVAGTNRAPINTDRVDILLQKSSNWGDFEILSAGTANDGSEWIKMPENTQNNVRILVRASNSIYFDISNRNFDIVEAASPGFSFGVSPNSARVCLPDIFETEIQSSAFGGFQGTLQLDVISGLPAEASYQFGSNMIDADENTTLSIDLTNVTDRNDFVFTVQAISSTGDTLLRNISLDIVSNDYSRLQPELPVDGEQGVSQSPTLSWPDIVDADYYNVELATSPSFDPASIIEVWNGISTTSVAVSDLLDKNTIYFWRVQAGNVCGDGSFTQPAAFSTEAASCAFYTSPDRNIRVQKGQSSEFYINIFQDAEINDINISHFDFYCDFLQDAIVSLVSPQGTEVILSNKKCGNTTTFLCSLDDDAPTRIKCPPADGRAYQPDGKLADFNGERAVGRWTLKLNVLASAVSSELGGWELEVCANTILDAPYMVNNDTMKNKPGENNVIVSSLLRAEDNNNTSEELTYTLSTTTGMGTVLLNGTILQAGMTFTQADLNAGNVRYNNLAGAEGIDHFTFTVDDGEGGWTGSHRFIIALDEDFPTSVNDLASENAFSIFPNPNPGSFTVVFDQSLTEATTLTVLDMKGRIMDVVEIAQNASVHSIEMKHTTPGIYMIKIANSKGIYSRKMSVQHR